MLIDQFYILGIVRQSEVVRTQKESLPWSLVLEGMMLKLKLQYFGHLMQS